MVRRARSKSPKPRCTKLKRAKSPAKKATAYRSAWHAMVSEYYRYHKCPGQRIANYAQKAAPLYRKYVKAHPAGTDGKIPIVMTAIREIAK